MLPKHFCSFDYSKNEMEIISERSIPVEHKTKLIGVEWSLIDEEEEIIHDESISLCQLIDAFVLIVEVDCLSEGDGANDTVDVNEYMHSDVHSIPEWTQ